MADIVVMEEMMAADNADERLVIDDVDAPEEVKTKNHENNISDKDEDAEKKVMMKTVELVTLDEKSGEVLKTQITVKEEEKEEKKEESENEKSDDKIKEVKDGKSDEKVKEVKTEKGNEQGDEVDIETRSDSGESNSNDASKLRLSAPASNRPHSGSARSTPDPGDEADGEDEVENDFNVPRMQGEIIKLYQRPFQYGWYREIVVRGTVSEGKKRAMDVYYFTPTGRKLRSTPQIADYVTLHPEGGLTKSNFTFAKFTVHKPPFEVVRGAGGGGGIKQKEGRKYKSGVSKMNLFGGKVLDTKQVTVTNNQIKSVVSKSLLTGEKRIQSVKAVTVKRDVSQSLTDQVFNALNLNPTKHEPPQIVKTVVIFPNKKPEVKAQEIQPKVLIPKPVEGRKIEGISSSSEDEDTDSVITINPDEESSNDTPAKKPKYKPVKARKSFAQKRPLPKNGVDEDSRKKPKVEGEKNRVCGMDCPGLFGMIPRLVCNICQCLFHHECVNMAFAVTSFSCKGCTEGKRQAMVNDPLCVSNFEEQTATTYSPAVMQAYSAVESTPLLVSAPQLIHQPLVQLSMSAAQNLTAPVMSPGVRPLPTLIRAPPRLRQGARPGPRLPSQLVPLSLLQPRAPIATATVPMVTATVPMATATVPMATAAKSGEADDRRGQLLTLPVGVMSQLKLDGPVELKVNGKMVVVNPDNFINTPEGAKILLPPETLDLAAGQAFNVSIPPSALRKSPAQTHPATVTTPNITPPAGKLPIPNLTTFKNFVNKKTTSPTVKTADGKKMKSPQCKAPRLMKKPAPKPTMRTMLQGYECMSKVFEYLDLPDLLRAAQVCKTWKSLLANHPRLQTVTLACSISDWQTFGDFLFSRKTESLDLCSLELTGKFDKEWKQFQSIVPRLRYLRNISLGQCPPSVLYSVVEELPFLETLQAEYITETDREPDVWCTNATIDLSRLSSFRCLRELRLRGMAGLNTQNSNYSRVQRLAQLKSLRKLSLTSLKQVDGFELSFLETLTLDELEIGDCDTWTDETYAYLNKMNLKKLHLENCGESDKHLSLALPNWQSLRELNLIMVAVNEGLGKSLARLTELESLSMCPDTRDSDSLTNRNTLLAVRDLKHLKDFLWCAVVSPNEESEENEMEFLRQGIEDSLYYGETGLPPPARMNNNNHDDSKLSDDDDDFSDLEIDEEIAMMKGSARKVKPKVEKNVSIVSEEEVIQEGNENEDSETDQKESGEKDEKDPEIDPNEIDESSDKEKVCPDSEKEEMDIAQTEISKHNEPKNGESVSNGVEEMEVDVENDVDVLNDDELNKNGKEETKMDDKTSSPKKREETDHVEEKSGVEFLEPMKPVENELKSITETNKTDESESAVSKPATSVSNQEKVDKSSISEISKLDDSNLESSKLDESVFSDSSKPNDSTTESARDSTAETSEKPKKPRKRRKKENSSASDAEPRRSGRQRTLKRSDDSSIAFITVETLIEILQFHLPDTDIRVDPIGLLK